MKISDLNKKITEIIKLPPFKDEDRWFTKEIYDFFITNGTVIGSISIDSTKYDVLGGYLESNHDFVILDTIKKKIIIFVNWW